MLKRLHIRNYALIRELDMEFRPGFNIITGETGAGKSILVGALSLLTGKRADTSVLRNSEEKCVVEGTFVIGPEFELIFRELDLDFEKESVIRREIAANGKSRAFINDTPVTLDTLKLVAGRFIDIHSQHEVFALADPVFRLQITDAFAQNSALLDEYRALFTEYTFMKKEWERSLDTAESAARELDYNRFLYRELEELDLKPGEQASLEQEQEWQTHALETGAALTACTAALSDADENVIALLQSIRAQLQKIARRHPGIETQFERLNSLVIDLKDVSVELASIAGEVQFDPERLQTVEDRLSALYTLMKKHGVLSGEDLIVRREELSDWLENVSRAEENSGELGRRVRELEAAMETCCVQLHESRIKGTELFSGLVKERLQQLAMPDAEFSGEVQSTDTFTMYGKDEIRYVFTANRGHAALELHKAASGGEMSRVMLAIKSAMAEISALPAIVFDEIDTGISGRVADMAGDLMKNLSAGIQVIAITHLPQIAGKGNAHYRVEKFLENDVTSTRLVTLKGEERVREVAAMLSGENLTEAALENARILLGK
ncbi:MAG: DNA repair protein RecN [Bacteroidia bacterium]|nr:DNA repair protein RecN [Bacteroidia bacterium]